MEVVIGIVIVAGIIGFVVRKSRTTRISYQRDIKPANEAKRVPVTDKCPCKQPGCPYKGKEHPKTVRMYRYGRKP